MGNKIANRIVKGKHSPDVNSTKIKEIINPQEKTEEILAELLNNLTVS